ncbi:MAG: alpha/beta fold hydrolase [Bacteroidaceae bacterium]|nr:alpha/beta fold hydrolase [Bacteroidaceae bacterium]
MKRAITVLLFVANVMGISAQEGTWCGELDIQGMKLPLVFNFTTEGCTMDSPSQGVKGLKAEKSYTQEGKLKVSVPMIGAIYEGVFLMNMISGSYTQNGMSFPLTLKPGAPKVNRPQTPKGPFPYNTEEVRFQNGTYTFNGTLVLPKDCTAETPVVLFVTGSGQQDRDEALFEHKPFAVIADALARNGIASLRYDDRGYGDSSVPFFNFTTDDFRQDASAGLDFLRKRFSKVGIVGHSEGGTIALMLAAEGKTDFIVSLAGMAVSGKETLLWQNRVSLQAMGIPQAGVDQYIDIISTVFDHAAEGKLDTTITSLAPEAMKPLLKQAVKQLSTPYIQHILTVDVRPLLPKIQCPVLALNGKMDMQVDCQANLQAMEKGLVNSKHEVMALDNLNHLFQHCKTGAVIEYQQIEETFAPEALQKITEWLKAH